VVRLGHDYFNGGVSIAACGGIEIFRFQVI